MRAICSQKMRRRISGPKARRARAAEVATSTKVHKGRAQTNRATAWGRRAASCGAAEKRPAIAVALSVTRRAIRLVGTIAISKASLTAPCASASPSAGTTRCSASGMERWTMLVARLTAPQSTT